MSNLPTLNLALKAEYFNAIKDGGKVEVVRDVQAFEQERMAA